MSPAQVVAALPRGRRVHFSIARQSQVVEAPPI
jgi:hypothetical protein